MAVTALQQGVFIQASVCHQFASFTKQDQVGAVYEKEKNQWRKNPTQPDMVPWTHFFLSLMLSHDAI